MGRWSQARLRGSVGLGAGPAGPPPAPVLDDSSGDVIQTAQGQDDTGGTLVLETSEDGGDNWDVWEAAAWAASKNWGNSAQFDLLLVRAKEVGNDITYIGESPPSNTLDYR